MSSSFSNTNMNNTSNPTSCGASDASSIFSFKGPNSDLKSKSKKHWFSRSSSSSVSSKSKGNLSQSSPSAMRSTEKMALHNEAIATYMSYR
ncbi:uncharacterized protein BDW47DRAFT_97673 [Aspergillus candidus]|uniref:Uncharacterized protein n=1 Tax=Aspergillus candidus TaxID=41067 RepID=A0A2I2FPZ9_ASPCN|nr:hypothetical protein BDW47DRAFT_97673 [Aspergillus candidus]PLB42686.1 hypothetical protein BDW47DRAFT_97673 [Aspergillus candidus]